jgi:hypothetical protein
LLLPNEEIVKAVRNGLVSLFDVVRTFDGGSDLGIRASVGRA